MEEEKNKNKHVVFIGDSTIDNLIWVKNQKYSVAHYVKEQLSADWKVTNYAADGFTTSDVLNGAFPSISIQQRTKTGDPFPLQNGIFSPLEQLEELHKQFPVSHVILSVGGNDIRVILHKIQNLLAVLPQFTQNYEEIVKRLLKITPNIIFMTQYRPSSSQDHFYHVYEAMKSIPFLPGNPIDKINGLMGVMYSKVFQFANEHKIAVIDLSNTYEPRYSKLFECQIEPSRFGSQLSAKLISHVLQNHSWDSPNHSIYSIPPSNYDFQDEKIIIGEVISVVGNGQWKVVDDPVGSLQENIEKWEYKPTGIAYFDEENSDDGGEKSNKNGGDDDENAIFQLGLAELNQMGFTDKEKNLKLLKENGGDVGAVVDALISLGT